MAQEKTPPSEAPKSVEGERHVSEVAPLSNPAAKKLGMTVMGVAGLLIAGVVAVQGSPHKTDKVAEKAKANLSVRAPSRPFEVSTADNAPPAQTLAADPNALPLGPASDAPPLPGDPAPPLGNAQAGAPQPGSAQSSGSAPINLNPAGVRSSRLVVYGGGGLTSAAQSVRSSVENSFPSAPGAAGDGAGNSASELANALNPATNASNTVRASLLRNQPYLLTAGTIVPCTLQTAMDSTLAGFVTCIIPQDVVGKSGLTLFDRGTKVIGEFQGGATRGKPRLFVLWTRAETPQGVVINLNSPAADPVGRSGLAGSVDNRFWDRFGAALLLSTVDGAIEAGVQSQSKGGTTINTGQTQQVIDSVMRDSINLPPIIRKHQGETVSIFVRQDLDFSSVYGLQPVQQARVSAVRK